VQRKRQKLATIGSKSAQNRPPGSGTAGIAALVPLDALPKFDRHNTYC
jgi:hypothetical protein